MTRSEREALLEKLLDRSRFIMVVPVAFLLAAALGAFVYGAVLFVDSTRKIVDHSFPVSRNVGYFIVVIDIFLVGATLLIAAFGFYELFISRADGQGRQSLLPEWLVMNDLNDLKMRVISMIVLVSAVSFVDGVVDFQGGRDILYLGSAVALVIVALTVFVRFGAKDHG